MNGTTETTDSGIPAGQADSGTPEGQATGTEAGTPDLGQVADDQVVKLADGREVPVKELRKGFVPQSEYTKGRQAFAEERKAFEAERKTHADLVQFGALVESNPKLAQAIRNVVQEHLSTGAGQGEEAEEEGGTETVTKPVKRAADLTPITRELWADMQLRKVKDYARDNFGETLTEERLAQIVNHANELGITDLKVAYRDMMVEPLRAKALKVKDEPTRDVPKGGARAGGAERVARDLKEATAMDLQEVEEFAKKRG